MGKFIDFNSTSDLNRLVDELQERIIVLENENNRLELEKAEAETVAKKWEEYHDAAAEDAKKWRKDAQELYGALEGLLLVATSQVVELEKQADAITIARRALTESQG